MSAGRAGHRRITRIAGQFAAREIEMLESPAFRVLSLSAHRVLARIEIELAHHGGNDNGALPVTFEDFMSYGIDRHAIAPAERELDALGIAKIEVHGSAGNADFRAPNLFRLTYKHTSHALPTNEWRRIQTIEEAVTIQKAARAPVRMAPKRKPVGVKTETSVGNPHRKPEQAGGENPHYDASAFSPTTLDISGDSSRMPASAAVCRPDEVK
jgi:hypothetical protein